MILTVNVSNSNILLGAYQDDKQCFCSSMHTNLLKSADEYAVQFGSVLSLYGAQPEDISGVILSCVVPSMLACVRKALNHLYTGRIYVAGPGLNAPAPAAEEAPVEKERKEEGEEIFKIHQPEFVSKINVIDRKSVV